MAHDAWECRAVVGAAAMLMPVGCGQAATEQRPAFEAAEELPEKLGADGTTITVGDTDAEVKVHLYEDPRCPVCEQFELGGPQLPKAMLNRSTRCAPRWSRASSWSTTRCSTPTSPRRASTATPTPTC
ncbi:thioredoxin domain-containing protein [Streptomyces sp. CA-179760]|uniref:thioredoxin domain-containing protein n=1 Tax=Streptomyces sp. CA-179760 TaxID=3240054 RepID=UPI003D8A620A